MRVCLRQALRMVNSADNGDKGGDTVVTMMREMMINTVAAAAVEEYSGRRESE